MVVPRWRHLAGGNHERAVDEAEVDLDGESLLTRDRIRTDVGAREDGRRPHLAGGAHRFGHDVAHPNVERRTERSQRRVEVGK